MKIFMASNNQDGGDKMNHNENGTIAIGAPGSLARMLTSKPDVQSKYRHDNNVSTSTPWGTSQTARYYGKGLIQYSTASHGGFHVSPTLLELMPAEVKSADKYADGENGWFEEDCGWSLVAISLPEFFTVEERMEALRIAERYYPAAVEAMQKIAISA